jgi:hypothetical protein
MLPTYPAGKTSTCRNWTELGGQCSRRS